MDTEIGGMLREAKNARNPQTRGRREAVGPADTSTLDF